MGGDVLYIAVALAKLYELSERVELAMLVLNFSNPNTLVNYTKPLLYFTLFFKPLLVFEHLPLQFVCRRLSHNHISYIDVVLLQWPSGRGREGGGCTPCHTHSNCLPTL